MSAAYSSAEALSVRFEQRLDDPITGGSQRSSGEAVLSRTGYRIETDDYVFVTDGVTTWMHNRPAAQVALGRYEEDSATFALNRLLFAPETQYRVEGSQQVEQGGVALVALKLAAKDASAEYPDATIYLRDHDAMIVRVEARDAAGSSLTLALDRVTLLPKAPADAFTFAVPAGVEVVDLR